MWWKSGFPKHLPLTQGPFAAGCIDVMTGYSAESSFLRIYYPSSLTREENNQTKWFKWLPHEKYLEGFAHVINSWPSLLKFLVWSYGQPLVPASWETPVLLCDRKLPVIIFSHGFGATRFISATIGAEMASYGYVFASIEHRETSACKTYYYESPEKLNNSEPTWIRHEKMVFGPDHYAVRNEQLHKRMEEIKKVLAFIENLNEGKATNILQSEFDLTSFKGLLDLSSICMMGHSFGGAASLLTLANDKRLTSGVILDGWMFPIKEEDIIVEQPLLFINTQTFHIESNLVAMDKIISEPKEAIREVYTIKHTTHETQTDMPQIIGYWLNWFMYKLDPVVGTNINNHLILRFFRAHTGMPLDIENSEKYLEDQKTNIVNGTFLYSKDAKRRFSVRDEMKSRI